MDEQESSPDKKKLFY